MEGLRHRGAQTDAGYPEHAFTFDVAKRLARLLRAEAPPSC
jgi:N-acetylmuramoyl-L-alanine amidase